MFLKLRFDILSLGLKFQYTNLESVSFEKTEYDIANYFFSFVLEFLNLCCHL